MASANHGFCLFWIFCALPCKVILESSFVCLLLSSSVTSVFFSYITSLADKLCPQFLKYVWVWRKLAQTVRQTRISTSDMWSHIQNGFWHINLCSCFSPPACRSQKCRCRYETKYRTTINLQTTHYLMAHWGARGSARSLIKVERERRRTARLVFITLMEWSWQAECKKREMRLCPEICQINNWQLSAVDHTAITSTLSNQPSCYIYIMLGWLFLTNETMEYFGKVGKVVSRWQQFGSVRTSHLPLVSEILQKKTNSQERWNIFSELIWWSDGSSPGMSSACAPYSS